MKETTEELLREQNKWLEIVKKEKWFYNIEMIEKINKICMDAATALPVTRRSKKGEGCQGEVEISGDPEITAKARSYRRKTAQQRRRPWVSSHLAPNLIFSCDLEDNSANWFFRGMNALALVNVREVMKPIKARKVMKPVKATEKPLFTLLNNRQTK
ncbi:hypothetical protein RND71_026394 [Anisodus tanguticus]|uniref:Uncharacterized protein n=1 Tax=Anisodus tanguticus TaxID=243964 RepID=A0AAE1RKV4_9SOLA|nr:hypothetical protein RND71_026394 [Anisodus tanguticus]